MDKTIWQGLFDDLRIIFFQIRQNIYLDICTGESISTLCFPLLSSISYTQLHCLLLKSGTPILGKKDELRFCKQNTILGYLIQILLNVNKQSIKCWWNHVFLYQLLKSVDCISKWEQTHYSKRGNINAIT